MFQKGVIVVVFPSLEFNKRKGRKEGREEEETRIFCTNPCAGHVDAVNPQHTLRRGKLSLSKAEKLPAFL